jgi:MFS family permease
MVPEERAWLVRRLAEDAAAMERSGGHVGGDAGIFSVLARILKERRVLLIGAFMFLSLGSYYAFSFSAPAIYLAATGWSTNGVGMLIAGISLAGAGAMLLGSWHSDRMGVKVPYIVGLSLVTAAAFAASGLVREPWMVVAALALASVSYYAVQGPSLSFSTTFLDGPSAAVGVATINMMSIAGGVVGPNWMAWSIEHTGATRLGTGMLGVAFAAGAGMIFAARGKKRVDGSSIP